MLEAGKSQKTISPETIKYLASLMDVCTQIELVPGNPPTMKGHTNFDPLVLEYAHED